MLYQKAKSDILEQCVLEKLDQLVYPKPIDVPNLNNQSMNIIIPQDETLHLGDLDQNSLNGGLNQNGILTTNNSEFLPFDKSEL